MNRFIDIKPSRCIGCSTCRAACSAGHQDAGYQGEPRLHVVDNRTVTASMTCHHCEGAPCYRVCPTNSIRRDADGCIRVDETHCIGCKMCAIACPFGAIHMSGTGRGGVAGIEYATPEFPPTVDPILRWEIGVYPVSVKCDLCEYNDYVPMCVMSCPTDALSLVELNEDDPDYNAKKRRQVQAEEVMFENIDQAIPEGIAGLKARRDAVTYVSEQARANDDYVKGLRELGIEVDDGQVPVLPNKVVDDAADARVQPDSVKVLEERQKERFLREVEHTPAGVRSRQVDTDNVIDQLSVGVTASDMSAHATAYKRALDLQNAGSGAAGVLEGGIAQELAGARPEDGDAGIEYDPRPPREPSVSHGDQVKYNPGRPADPPVTESSKTDDVGGVDAAAVPEEGDGR